MSVTSLAVLVLLVGVVTYRLLERLVKPARKAGTCLVMVLLATFIIVVRNRETIGPNPQSIARLTFQKISKEDHEFLNGVLQRMNREGQWQVLPTPAAGQKATKAGIVGSLDEPELKTGLVINSLEMKSSEPVVGDQMPPPAVLRFGPQL
jgi:hypothetical protein